MGYKSIRYVTLANLSISVYRNSQHICAVHNTAADCADGYNNTNSTLHPKIEYRKHQEVAVDDFYGNVSQENVNDYCYFKCWNGQQTHTHPNNI